MEGKRSLRWLRKSDTCPCRTPHQSSPCPPTLFIQDTNLYLPSFYT